MMPKTKFCSLLILGCILIQTAMTLPTKKEVDVGECKDMRDDCKSDKFLCEYYERYMLKHCRSSCNLCHMRKDEYIEKKIRNMPESLRKKIEKIWDFPVTQPSKQ